MFIVVTADRGNLYEARVVAKDIPTFEDAQKAMEEDMLRDLDEAWEGLECDGDWDEYVNDNKHITENGGYLFDGVDDYYPEWIILEV